MKTSNFPLWTLRKNPNDAPLPSHSLMLRAGLIQKTTSGLYAFLPLGLRSLQKLANIVRQEMQNIGALEFLMPVLIPKDTLLQSNRWLAFQNELFRIIDRKQSHFALAPTNEEDFARFVKNSVHSYRSLPLLLFQINHKFRDEIRPRFGLMRAKEFLMKDAYSFHLNSDSLDATYQKIQKTYSKILNLCNLDFCVVNADSGNMGGSASQEFMVKSSHGEDSLLICQNCNYSANLENARESVSPPPPSPPSNPRLIANTSQFKKNQIVNALCFQIKISPFQKSSPPIPLYAIVFIRDDYKINNTKLSNAFASLMQLWLPPNQHGSIQFSQTSRQEGEKIFRAPQEFWGPVSLDSTTQSCTPFKPLIQPWTLFDVSLLGLKNAVAGANQVDTHFSHLDLQKYANMPNSQKNPTYPYALMELYSANHNAPCPNCNTPLQKQQGIEVAHIFKLGTKYSKTTQLQIPNPNGTPTFPTMGCYGIGVSRLLAAVVQQSHDKYGIAFPSHVAPFSIVIITIGAKNTNPQNWNASQKIYQLLTQNPLFDVLWDDREERPGTKLMDADLIGFPIQIIVGQKNLQNNNVEIKIRKSLQTSLLPIQNNFIAVQNFLNQFFSPN